MIKGHAFIMVVLLFLLAGCGLEAIVPPEYAPLARSVSAVAKAARPIDEQEEYHLGRAVAARILSTYPLVKDKKLTDYVNLVGQAVALHSDKPITYAGYHFAILESREINAFACPGGTILITRGMVDAVQSEDELAAVLAHEVAHINHQDGIGAIEKSRWTEAVAIIGSEAAKSYGSQELGQLVSLYEGSIEDVFKTLVVNGYGQSQESQADETAVQYLARTGYDPLALAAFLERLLKRGGTGGGLFTTHPATGDRLEKVRASLPSQLANAALEDKRNKRFAGIVKR